MDCPKCMRPMYGTKEKYMCGDCGYTLRPVYQPYNDAEGVLFTERQREVLNKFREKAGTRNFNSADYKVMRTIKKRLAEHIKYYEDAVRIYLELQDDLNN